MTIDHPHPDIATLIRAMQKRLKAGALTDDQIYATLDLCFRVGLNAGSLQLARKVLAQMPEGPKQ